MRPTGARFNQVACGDREGTRVVSRQDSLHILEIDNASRERPLDDDQLQLGLRLGLDEAAAAEEERLREAPRVARRPRLASPVPSMRRAIRRDGDRLVSDDGVLAGSTLTMAGAIANAVDQGRLSIPQAVRMATGTPAQFLGIAGETGAIGVGLRADLVAMTDDFTVTQTWVRGEPSEPSTR